MPDRPGPIAIEEQAKGPQNQQAVGAFILAFIVWEASRDFSSAAQGM
jgi:hypothetical protein